MIALLPVAAILFIGGGLLGAGELNDLALVLFIGMLSGTYSSICIATPVLADLKERDPQYKALAKRVAQRASGTRAARRAAAKAPSGAVAGAGAGGHGCRPALDTDERDLPDADVRRPGSGRRRRRAGRPGQGHGGTGVPPGPRRPSRAAPAAAPEHLRGQAPPRRQEEAALDGGGQGAAGEGGPQRRAPRAGPPRLRDIAELIQARVRDIADYPQPGVMFKDITPLLADRRRARRGGGRAVQRARRGGQGGRDRGPRVHPGRAGRAASSGAGFVPVRKQGKLPGPTYAQSYDLEYGSATIEVHQDAFAPGERVLIVDDVLATGGTGAATRGTGPQGGCRGRRARRDHGTELPRRAGPAARRPHPLTAGCVTRR